MYSSFTFLELVKAISVHRAHRLLPEATLILWYVEEQAFGDRQWFRPASERQRYQLQAKQHSPRALLPDSDIRCGIKRSNLCEIRPERIHR